MEHLPSLVQIDSVSPSKKIETLRQADPPEISMEKGPSSMWQRVLVGVFYVSLGTLTTVVGLASIAYRLTHLTIDGALVNAPATRIQAPVDSQIKNFNARPGKRVKPGQVLAQLRPVSQQFQRHHSPHALTAEASSTTIKPDNNAGNNVDTHNSSSESSLIPLLAPFEGVVYITNYDGDEQVNRLAILLSLVDCNRLWVETLMTRDQARRINVSHPVYIRQDNRSETVVSGKDSITIMPVADVTNTRSGALLSPLSTDFTGQSWVRVRVDMPLSQFQAQNHEFCGVGDSAQLTFGTQIKPMAFLRRLFRV